MNQDLVQVAKKYFKLDLPISVSELKSAFRREARIHHPDKGGDGIYFGKLKKAYSALIKAPEVLLSTSAQEVPMTIEGIPLSELGIGVMDGVDCSSCDAKGYTTIEDWSRIICPSCRGSGYIIPCPLCKKNGISKKCRRCHGEGVLGALASHVELSNIFLCSTCSGNGGFRRTKPSYRHMKCGDCDGKGQRSMFNPLWPSGRVAG